MNSHHSPTLFAREEGLGPTGGADTGGTFADTKHRIAESARETASKMKSAASDTAARAREQASQMAQEKKETAASRIGDYSSAMHESARSLEEKDPNIAWFTHRAADRLQNVANYVRNCDWTNLRGDCEGIARRHPAVFFGGMFFAGLVVGNLMKASQRKLDDDDMSAGFAPGDEWEPETLQATEPEVPVSTSVPGM